MNEKDVTDAIAALTARLDAWGVEEAPARAGEHVNDMLRAGWRPVRPDVRPPVNGDHLTPRDAYPTEVAHLRGLIRTAPKETS